jgi:hypothetical protein
MLRCVALVRTDVSEERIAFIITVTRIGKLGRTIAVTSEQRTQRKIRRNIPEDGILDNHSRENLKSYVALTGWAL